MIVRSSATATRFAGGTPDLKALATEADVDRAVMGTLLRSGDQLQANVQLVETPAGTIVTSHSVLSSLGDLFRLQENIARRVVEALALPLVGAGPSTPDVPRDARAYELYLRANAMARSYDRLPEARDLYRRCVELDPRFAPGWAQLGRCLRVIAKYVDDSEDGDGPAEQAFRRALELSPRLPIAHKYYANLEADSGQTRQAMARLLGEAGRHGNDPELFAGLVHACRYCGLFDQSLAAHDEARRLDPNVPTSMEQTLLMTGDIERLLEVKPRKITGGDEVIRAIGLGMAGRRDEARQTLRDMREAPRTPAFRPWTEFLMAWLDRRVSDMLDRRAALGDFKIMLDPEAIFSEGWLFCDAGDHARGFGLLQQAVERGYYVESTLVSSRSFDALRGDTAFQELVAQAAAGRAQALAAFRDGGGERLLG
jgi:tetratricopeptide (TPR) repeat protein